MSFSISSVVIGVTDLPADTGGSGRLTPFLAVVEDVWEKPAMEKNNTATKLSDSLKVCFTTKILLDLLLDRHFALEKEYHPFEEKATKLVASHYAKRMKPRNFSNVNNYVKLLTTCPNLLAEESY
jgi:hypothetical protein